MEPSDGVEKQPSEAAKPGEHLPETGPEMQTCKDCKTFMGTRDRSYLCSQCFENNPEAKAKFEAMKKAKEDEEQKAKEDAEMNKKPEQVSSR